MFSAFATSLKYQAVLDALQCLRTHLLCQSLSVVMTGELHVLIHRKTLRSAVFLRSRLPFCLTCSVIIASGISICCVLYSLVQRPCSASRALRQPSFFSSSFAADIILVLSQCIELGYILCELIVCCRKLLYLDLIYRTLEYCRLALELCCMILLREGNVYFYFFTDLCTDQLILKARDEAAGTDRQRIILSLCRPRTAAPSTKPSKSSLIMSPFSTALSSTSIVLELFSRSLSTSLSTSSSETSTRSLLYFYALVITKRNSRL